MIADALFWIGWGLGAAVVATIAIAHSFYYRLERSDYDRRTVQHRQVQLLLVTATIMFFLSAILSVLITLTLMRSEGAGVLPGVVFGEVAGAALVAWNPWLRQFVRSSVSEGGTTAEFGHVVWRHYRPWLPIALVSPVLLVTVGFMLTFGYEIAAFGLLIMVLLSSTIATAQFCLSVLTLTILARYAKEKPANDQSKFG